MKRMKKIVSILLAVVMVLGMSITSFAENSNQHTITITNPKDGHTYTAYQIFKGDLYTQDNGSKVLTNIEWGTGIDSTKTETLIGALKAESTFPKKEGTDVNVFEEAETAADVAAALVGFSDAQADKFSEIVSNYLSATGTANEEPFLKDGKYEYTINVTGDGYYFVKDTGDIADGDAATRYILQVLANVDVTAKADAPSIDKEIHNQLICGEVEGESHAHTATCYDDVKYNNAALGDTVPFIVKSDVPKMDGYEKYFFVVKDTLSQGLTFNNDIIVKVGGKTLKVSLTDQTESYYVKSYNAAGDLITETTEDKTVRSFEIVFVNFIQYKGIENTAIEITYSATINSDVVVGTTGNPNEVELKYSNNPNEEDHGDPDEPDYPSPDSPVGETPKSKTITYVTALQLEKIDANTKAALSGAQFTITATTLNKVLVNKTEFLPRTTDDTVTATNPVYYLLKDGTYTKTAPNFSEDENQNTADYYDNLAEDKKSVTLTYKMVTSTVTEVSSSLVDEEGNNTKTYTAYVDADGILTLKGLSAGTYVIEEIKAPNGYNLLKENIEIVVDWTAPDDDDVTGQCEWTVVQKGTPDKPLTDVVTSVDVDEEGNEKTTSTNTGIYVLTVENSSGLVLPSTGGIGTTIFYVVGGILVLAAVVLLVTKKRMSAEK